MPVNWTDKTCPHPKVNERTWTLPDATTTAAGAMSAADKVRLDSLVAGGNATSIQSIPVDPASPGALETLLYNPGTGKWTSAQVGVGLVANDVSTSIIQDDAVTTAKINVGAVTTAKINDSAVTTSKIADDAVTSDKIADGGVNSNNLFDSAVTTAKINTNAVTTSKIADDAVTGHKIATTAIVAYGVEGRNGVGACTLTGAVVGDKLLGYGWIYGPAAPADSPGFESTITVNDQIQQSGAANLTGHGYVVTLLKTG